jgi:hypothetical protein
MNDIDDESNYENMNDTISAQEEIISSKDKIIALKNQRIEKLMARVKELKALVYNLQEEVQLGDETVLELQHMLSE